MLFPAKGVLTPADSLQKTPLNHIEENPVYRGPGDTWLHGFQEIMHFRIRKNRLATEFTLEFFR